LYLEELESRALLSSVHAPPIWDTAFSQNWSGYAAETNLNTPASNAVTAVSGSWTVPTVTGKTTAFSAIWVGIDGANSSSNSVEQLGTEQNTSRSGAATYDAWWEMFPNPSVRISSLTISPGDKMSASVTTDGLGTFTLQMTDNTTGQSFSTTQSSTSAQRSSAEWIVEAPSSFFGILPLANFGTVNFSSAQATINGTPGAIDNANWQNTSIDMVNRSGTTIAHTSGLTDTNSTSSFSVAFTGGGGGGGGGHGHGHSPLENVVIVMPIQSNFQTPATSDAMPNRTTEHPIVSTGQDLIASAPIAGTLSSSFAPTHVHGLTSDLETSWDDSQSDMTEEAMPSDTKGPDGVSQSP
jgi:hypothetical protein